jgi:hypothetical protein
VTAQVRFQAETVNPSIHDANRVIIASNNAPTVQARVLRRSTRTRSSHDLFNANRTMRQAVPINTPVRGTEVHHEDESVIQAPVPTGQQCVIRDFTRTKTSLTQFNPGGGAASNWTNHVMKAKIQLSSKNTVNGIEASDDRNSAKSRTGILESEFIVLSSRFRSLIPVK